MIEKQATVEDLIEILKMMPPKTKVMVLETDFSGYSVRTRYAPLEISEYLKDDLMYISEHVDYHVNGDESILYFGCS